MHISNNKCLEFLSKRSGEEDGVKMLQSVSPLFVSASSWLIISIDNEKIQWESAKLGGFKKKLPLKLLSEPFSQNSSTSKQIPNYYNRDVGVKQTFYHGNKSYFMLQKDWNSKREIASLTKIMTLFTVLKLAQKFNLSMLNETIWVSREATQMIGTSAWLRQNDLLSVWDLCHAMMLPSGNDAAFALAEHFGDLLIKDAKQNNRILFFSNHINKNINFNISKPASKWVFTSLNKLNDSEDSKFSETDESDRYRSYFTSKKDSEYVTSSASLSMMHTPQTKPDSDDPKSATSPSAFISEFEDNPAIFKFIEEMNKNAKQLQMNDTHFDSPHGMANKNNKSTAIDMAKLCMHWVKIKYFNMITKWKAYQCNVKKRRGSVMVQSKPPKSPKPDYKWYNTNKLLSKGYVGIKTGVTNTAGPWLAAYITKKKRSYLVILLNSRSMDARWVGK